jgi:hypothetical protein
MVTVVRASGPIDTEAAAAARKPTPAAPDAPGDRAPS